MFLKKLIGDLQRHFLPPLLSAGQDAATSSSSFVPPTRGLSCARRFAAAQKHKLKRSHVKCRRSAGNVTDAFMNVTPVL